MDNMEHAIEQAADILGAHPEAFNVTDYTDEQTTMITAPVEDIARVLADAGLLAPAALREEWGIRWDDGVWEYYRNRAETEVGAGDGGTPVRRYVSDWLPVDHAEGERRTGNENQ